VQVVVIDPLYLCLLAGCPSISASNLFQIGPVLWVLGEACLDVGATPVLVHHTTKGSARQTNRATPLDLDDLAFAGIGEYARQWLLLARLVPYEPGTGDHHLQLSVGGSAGHSGSWAVHVQEGVLDGDFQGRRWQVRVQPAAAASPVPGTGRNVNIYS
jgi:replicative DNA helicase